MPVPYRAIAERRVTDRLMAANAVWPGSSQPLEHLRPGQARALTRLVTAGVIREEGAGRYYLYAPAYAARMSSRRRRIAIAMICVIVAMSGVFAGFVVKF
jgi:hypothetical protein